VGGTPDAFTSTDARNKGRYSVQALEDTLDWMYENKEPFMGSYELCSGLERFEGGQGLVQFCHRTFRKDEFAIKCAFLRKPKASRRRNLFSVSGALMFDCH
jgi:hypothetical protein